MLQELTGNASRVPSGDQSGVLDVVGCGLLILDAGGVIRHANRAALAMLKPAQAEGEMLDDVLACSGLQPVALQREATTSVVLRLPRDEAVGCTAQPLDAGGWALTLVDLTAHLRAGPPTWSDPLTGLFDRQALRERLRIRLGDPGPHGPQGAHLSVLCVDLDRFKAINDTLGHPMGDTLLCKVADRLKGMVRAGDVVARMGGDEFAIMHLSPSPASTSEVLAKRVVDVIGRAYAINGHILNVGASVGIAVAPADGTDPDDLLRKSDLALHVAKAEGRGTFRFFEGGMEARLNARRALELDLRKALAGQEFRLVYQPQIELATGRICGFEALLRWHHPGRGVVSPADFIPLAEEIGLIVPIGEWVLRAACKEAASWPASVRVAVNLSPEQFRSPHLFESIASALARSKLDPGRLELEITEGALIHDTEVVLDLLNRVRALGAHVSMDDFGTGYSSLSYLQRFPFDKIKIDQSFVRGADPSHDKQAIVRAVAGLGASLGMRTTAEGVETPEQLERVRQEGCTEVQGYLLGRPLSPEDAIGFLAAHQPDPPDTRTAS